MRNSFFGDAQTVKYEGTDTQNPMAFRHYDPDKKMYGKTMEDHLRFAVCYWHSFGWPGSDPFGGQTFQRPWFADQMQGDAMAAAKLKADVAFDMFSILNVPFYCFHDFDVRPEGKTLMENTRNLEEITDYFLKKQNETGRKLLWGTANLFTHRRYMSGAATNPDPDVFAFAAATVKTCMDSTLKLEGQKYNVHCNALTPVAYTRMTSNLMPPEAEQLLTPESVTPAAIYLVSENAPNGTILCAGAGVYSVSKIMESDGLSLGLDAKAEDILENWDKISDFSKAKAFNSGGEQTGKVFEKAMETINK